MLFRSLIMKRILTIGILLMSVVLSAFFLYNKTQERGDYFELVIGNERIPILINDNWENCEKMIFERVQPLWDNLESGESEVFYITHKTIDETSPELVKAFTDRHGDDVRVESSTTITSPHWRFYRDRGGVSGLEQAPSESPALEMISGTGVDWPLLKSYLHDEIQQLHENFGFTNIKSEQGVPLNR